MLHGAEQNQPALSKQKKRRLSLQRICSARWLLVVIAVVDATLSWRSLTIVQVPGVIDHQLGEMLVSPTVGIATSNYVHISLKPLSVMSNKFGRLHLHSVGNGSRHVDPNDHLAYEKERKKILLRMNEEEPRLKKEKYFHDDEIEDDPPGLCYRPNWKSEFHPNCNHFHDFNIFEDMLQNKLVFRGEATFRAAWTQHDNDWVLKTIQFHRVDNSKMFFALQKEATIMDVLSKSPRIVDIHGFCGLNTIAEFMPHEAESIMVRRLIRKQIFKLRKRENITGSLNNLASLDVLDVSIRLAESVADLHGFEGGVIVHGDLNTEQWLMNSKGEIKLNDFNNGFVMDWSRRKERYCGVSHGFVGSFFSPESHLYFTNATEKVDIYGFGSSLYAIMTGSYPYWQYERDDRNKRIQRGKAVPMEPYWRQKNTLDYHLSNLIWHCMEHNFAKRPTIFEVIKRLKNMRQLFLAGKLSGRRKKDPQLPAESDTILIPKHETQT